MKTFLIIFISVFFLVFLLRSSNTIQEIWKEIEEYENMRKNGYKPLKDQNSPQGPNAIDEFYVLAFLVLFFGLIGYFLGLVF